MSDYDVIVIGGGVTGNMAASMLQKRGKKVLLLEKNDYLGGLACNMHKWPGYTHNTGMWYLMFARLEWMEKEFELTKNGLELIYPQSTGVVMGGYGKGRHPYQMYMDPEQQMEHVAKYHGGMKAVKAFSDFYASLEPFQIAMGYAMEGAPMSIGEMMAAMPIQAQQSMKKLFYSSAKDYVNSFFPKEIWEDTAAIRGQMQGLACDGFYGGPSVPGSAFTLAYHATTPESGAGGSPYRYPKGHIGKFTETINKTFESYGGVTMLNAELDKYIVKDNAIVGVRLKDGTEITCDKLVSSLDPYNNFARCTDEKDLDPFFRSQVEDYKNEDCGEHITQLSLCLNKIPTYGPEFDYLNSDDNEWVYQTWTFDPDVGDANWNAINEGKVLNDIFGSGFLIPSLMDDTLAPEGKYSATICSTFTWPLNTPPEKYEEQIKRSTEAIIENYSHYLPNLRDCIDDTFLNCPPYWESEYHETGGTWTHGMIKLDNILNMRPIIGMTDFRGPFKNMYLCGTSNHPGPGVTGIQPRSAVRALLEDEGETFKM